MTEITIRFLIPLTCGYLVFVILADRFRPWHRPENLLARPRWLLGGASGATVAISLLLLLHFSYGKPAAQASAVAMPLGIVFLTLISGSIIAWVSYRSRCIESYNRPEITHQTGPSYSSAFTDDYHADEPAARDFQSDDLPESAPENKHNISSPTTRAEKNPANEVHDRAEEEASGDKANSIALEKTKITETEQNNPSTVKRALGAEEQAFLEQAKKIANQQYELRCISEKNLRITRKALLKLESRQYSEDAAKSEKELLLEAQLRSQIQSTARAENKLLREADKIGAVESRLTEAKQRVVEANAEVRSNIDARARAILTARKSVNFAKRSMEARGRAERQLESTRIQLSIQSDTTSKILKALEREKEKNRGLLNRLEALEEHQEAKGLRKVETNTTSKPWLSRVTTAAKKDKPRLVRKIAEKG